MMRAQWMVLLGVMMTALTGQTQVPLETDNRLHSDGKGWGLDQAARGNEMLPRVLLIGDSILGGYGKYVIEQLKGKAYVDIWVQPYHQGHMRGGYLSAMIKEVLAHGPYDVIAFNMGLHGWQKGRIPEGQFIPLTHQLVQALRENAPGARLLWIRTTPITEQDKRPDFQKLPSPEKPYGLNAELNPIIIEHNRMADEVMEDEKVPEIDFYSLMLAHLEWARGDMFHWKDSAYRLMADTLVPEIALRLPPVPGEESEARMVWELGRNPIDPATTKGKIELVDGVVKLDGANSFTIPADVLGSRKNYTIEFDLRRSPVFKTMPRMQGALRILSNRDPEIHAGLSFIYFPPSWDNNGGVSNRTGIDVNAYWNGESAGLDGDGFNKFSIVVKDGQASIYRNGLLQAMTGEIQPSRLPLTIGGQGWRGGDVPDQDKAVPMSEPYELRGLKIYDQAIAPTGYDNSTGVMRNCAGEGYTMQRADIEDPSLPRILVVGDSISMGYRQYIAEHFKGRAYVDYWVGGGWFGNDARGDDAPAKHSWRGVLSNGPYDVVSWNAMTLHMWNGSPGRCNEENYPEDMAGMIKFLRKTAPDTRLIWVRCTPVRTTPDSGPVGLDPSRNDRVVRLNGVTDKIMREHGIPEVDLYSLCLERMDTISEGSKDSVHWGQEVSREMADLICKEIERLLAGKREK